jgi:hypothetical protein
MEEAMVAIGPIAMTEGVAMAAMAVDASIAASAEAMTIVVAAEADVATSQITEVKAPSAMASTATPRALGQTTRS